MRGAVEGAATCDVFAASPEPDVASMANAAAMASTALVTFEGMFMGSASMAFDPRLPAKRRTR
jgi:hypothetical protein